MEAERAALQQEFMPDPESQADVSTAAVNGANSEVMDGGLESHPSLAEDIPLDLEFEGDIESRRSSRVANRSLSGVVEEDETTMYTIGERSTQYAESINSFSDKVATASEAPNDDVTLLTENLSVVATEEGNENNNRVRQLTVKPGDQLASKHPPLVAVEVTVRSLETATGSPVPFIHM